ncbi:MAG: CAP domain-containing protein [Blastocatellia bacterium]|nr:CAP domain-containing protein [Blastocatellia bacterium]
MPHRFTGILLLVSTLLVTAQPQKIAPPFPLNAEEKALVEMIHKYREANKQPPVKLSVKLTRAAQWLSEDNATNKPDDPDHTDSLGRDAGKRLAAFGYEAEVIKENIVVGAETAAIAFQTWKESAFHNRNMLNPDVKMMGVSRVCKKGAKSGCHWSVILGSTEDQAISQ